MLQADNTCQNIITNDSSAADGSTEERRKLAAAVTMDLDSAIKPKVEEFDVAAPIFHCTTEILALGKCNTR